MLGATVASFLMLVAQVTSHGITVSCHEADFPPYSDKSPSRLSILNLEYVIDGENIMLNISWAINVDVSINYLVGTRICIEGEVEYLCEYSPPLDKADLTGLKQVWFHLLEPTTPGSIFVQAANLPLPPVGSGSHYIFKEINIPDEQGSLKPAARNTPVTAKISTSFDAPESALKPAARNTPVIAEISTSSDAPESALKPAARNTPVIAEISTSSDAPESDLGMSSITDNGNLFSTIAVVIFGGLVGLAILASCLMTYERCGWNFATSLGFKQLPTSPAIPVSVLLVYPAENPAFQRAVLALAEFLQCHGGCSVALDMWQQGKIAELGPMRWLAEQAKAAQRVIVICPQPNHSLPKHGVSGPAIPAATHDLYPLILNMVASQAKSSSELAKFCVVQLGKRQDRTPGGLAAELRICKSFCLMKDLDKLCRRLHAQRNGEKKTAWPAFRSEKAYSEKGAIKLREAMEQLAGLQLSTAREGEALKSVTII